MKNNEIVIVTYDNYPNGNAGAVRQHIFAKAFMNLGYTVNLIGMGSSTDFQYREYEGVKYISFRYKKTDVIHKVLNKIFYMYRLKKNIRNMSPKVIMVVGIPLRGFRYLKKYARKYSIPLVHDSVEWYSKEEFNLGVFNSNYIVNDYLNRHMVDKNCRVIAISKYLENHFNDKGIRTCNIPFVQDVKNIVCTKKLLEDRIVIVYAGSIEKKDYFDAIIGAMVKLTKEELSKIELRIIGCNKTKFIEKTDIDAEVIDSIGESVLFLGRVPRDVVIDNLKEADFTVLIRPQNLRYAKAGFPTKVTESMSYATPVIANITSDLGDYLVDEFNSIVVRGNTRDDVLSALKKALSYDKNQIRQMCNNARKTAEEKLDYRLFYDDIKDIIGE